MLGRFIGLVVRGLRRLVQASPTLRSLVYDQGNRELFTDVAQHEVMLADTVRMSTYEEAIRRHVRPGDVVLDVGTGTGILAMLAARQGARRVHAIDHSPFIAVAERLAAHHGLDTIEFVRTNSRRFAPDEPVDVILHEQMGEGLFEENLVVNLLDLRERVLRPGGRILPARFGLYLEPVTLREDARVPDLWEHRIGGLSYAPLASDPVLERFRRAGHGNHLDAGLRHDIDHLLATPEPVLELDLDVLADADDLPTERLVEREIRRAGRLDGFCLYFRTEFDPDLSFSTSPLHPRTHWRSRFYRADGRRLAVGDHLRYRVAMDDRLRPHTWTVDEIRVVEPRVPPSPRAQPRPREAAS